MQRKIMISGCLLAVIFVASAQTRQSKTAPNGPQTPASAVPSAKWEPFWEGLLGITDAEFKAAGLERLSSQEAANLWSTIYSHRPVLTCGPTFSEKEKDEYRYVHLHVSGADSDAGFVGLLRGKLSAIKDAKMVPTDEDADLGVSVLTVSNQTDSHKFGITVSTNIYEPCVFEVRGGMASGATKFGKFLDQLINAGADQDGVASGIANTLDARDFDQIRQNHSEILKYVEKE